MLYSKDKARETKFRNLYFETSHREVVRWFQPNKKIASTMKSFDIYNFKAKNEEVFQESRP